MATTMMRERCARRARARSSPASSARAGYATASRVEVVVDELSDVGSRSLGDTKMQAQAQQVMIQTLNALPRTRHAARAATFVAAVAQHPAARWRSSARSSTRSRAGRCDEALALTNWVLDRPEAREKVDALAALRSERFLQGAALGERGSSATRCAPRWAPRSTARTKVLEDAQARDIAQIFVKSLEQPHRRRRRRAHLGRDQGRSSAARRARPSRPPPAASRRKPRRWRRRPSRRRRRWPWRPASSRRARGGGRRRRRRGGRGAAEGVGGAARRGEPPPKHAAAAPEASAPP